MADATLHFCFLRSSQGLGKPRDFWYKNLCLLPYVVDVLFRLFEKLWCNGPTYSLWKGFVLAEKEQREKVCNKKNSIDDLRAWYMQQRDIVDALFDEDQKKE